ncbi:S8 family serine peptidase [Ferdinandcohnia quinoae]|uniref:S8 family serine peptidase n=1 Tax=Fredinandcohnia quinoae TaxID=2918902 RepID=A0AAW5E4B0_9BACI|nr:S8 family serine peptidase [Fredinandcohnia sp. SECRCQ15]MCH1627780.1 S8 family serine peptidase [Fredinandcohnia sp. SECRCQ15]
MKKLLRIVVILSVILVALPNRPIVAEDLIQEKVNILFDQEIDYDLIKKVDGKVLSTFKAIHGVSVSLPKDQISMLKQNPAVKSVQLDHEVSIDRQITDWGFEKTKADAAQKSGLTGAGIKIAILDTGIDSSHPDLQITSGKCFISEDLHQNACSSYADNNGHGTHVAGIIAAQNNTIGTIGVAPSATIYAVKVLNSEGIGTTSSIVAGIEWAINNKVDIINLSLTTPTPDNAMKAMIDTAYKKGILVVAAAGNNGNSLGNTNTVEYPAKYSSVIGVGSINRNKLRVSSSATGAEVEIVAPGYQIYSTVPVSTDQDGNQDGYSWMTGTSMAAPFISGLLATYKENFPEKTNLELRQMLIQNALDLGNQGKDSWYGYGLAQAILASREANIEFNAKLVSSSNGVVSFELPPLNDNVVSYNVYRNGKIIQSNLTEISWLDYVLAGSYKYQFSQNLKDGQESGLSAPYNVQVKEPNFKDLPNENWHAPYIAYLTSESILSGFEDQTIHPNELVSRAQAISMIGRALGLDGTKRATVFSDVAPSSFASGYIESAYKGKIINGFSDGTIRPNQPVTRAEMAIMLANAYSLVDQGNLSFSDVTSNVTGHEAIRKIATAAITQGYADGTFKPYQYMTRADFSVFVARAENPYFR